MLHLNKSKNGQTSCLQTNGENQKKSEIRKMQLSLCFICCAIMLCFTSCSATMERDAREYAKLLVDCKYDKESETSEESCAKLEEMEERISKKYRKKRRHKFDGLVEGWYVDWLYSKIEKKYHGIERNPFE